MTSASGYRLFECPHCGLAYRITSYSSMNFMDYKRWSDGRFECRLTVSHSPLMTCSCGKLFLDSQVEFGDNVPNEKIYSDPGILDILQNIFILKLVFNILFY